MEETAGSAWFSKSWRFLTGAAGVESLPPPGKPEIAFAGRSNAGKSSLLNALVGQRGLARTSKAPGRTQEINFFEAGGVPIRLADLPGYGYARAPKAKVSAWTDFIAAYLRGRPNLVRVFLLIEAQVGLKPIDAGAMALLDEAAVAYQAVLTKADKLPAAKVVAAASEVEMQLRSHPAAFPRVLVTSAYEGTGIAELRAEIERVYGAAGGPPGRSPVS